MTIDEVIEREQYSAEANREMADTYHTDENIYLKEEEAFRNREDYHRQLAEWLNELKAYRKAEKKILENMRAWEKIYAEPLEWNVDDINSIKLAFYQEGKADAYTDCIGICEIAFGEVNADGTEKNS